MSDRDPTSPDPTSPGPAARGPAPSDPTPARASLTERWWWSPTLAIAVGVLVVVYQLAPLRSGAGLWLNWLVAGLGLALAAVGAARLLRAYRSR